ncbi:hypothetical protein GCM10009557_05850 [Virgisporangium ochraceum]|uniref:DUF7426 domain-containing protein n=1 Tax=Virgisporangium ochraceum TaxID=65505 RepID=A0A8J3ZLF7_9ACTN|nr:hypothetical protein [Virgisporangium ochraceum]GIJ66242.1 hypothetical protein Voc01_011590 [Virgisporangium ochraceum]
MSTNFGALDDLLDAGLEFTLKGKKYVIKPVDGLTGLWAQRMAEVAGAVREAETDEQRADAVAKIDALPKLDGDLTVAERMLGPLHAELITDGIHHEAIKILAKAAYIWVLVDADAAQRYLQAGGRPESAAPNRAARRTASRPSRSTGGATTTKKPATTSGTRSRKAAPTKASARKSTGRTS